MAQQRTFSFGLFDVTQQVCIGQVDDVQLEAWLHGLVFGPPQHIYEQGHCLSLI